MNTRGCLLLLCPIHIGLSAAVGSRLCHRLVTTGQQRRGGHKTKNMGPTTPSIYPMATWVHYRTCRRGPRRNSSVYPPGSHVWYICSSPIPLWLSCRTCLACPCHFAPWLSFPYPISPSFTANKPIAGRKGGGFSNERKRHFFFWFRCRFTENQKRSRIHDQR